jgi:hypothetical protein
MQVRDGLGELLEALRGLFSFGQNSVNIAVFEFTVFRLGKLCCLNHNILFVCPKGTKLVSE